MEIRLGEISVRAHLKTPCIPIQCHPYYAALSEWNPTIYNEYIRHSSYQSSKPSGSWDGYVDLALAIYTRGLTFSEVDNIQIVKSKAGWVCRHGKHRVCIMRFIYGPHAILKIEDGMVVGVSNYITNPLLPIMALSTFIERMCWV